MITLYILRKSFNSVRPAIQSSPILGLAGRVALVSVKETRDLLTQIRGMARVSARHGMFEKCFLDVGRQFGPLRDDGGSKALQDVLLGKAQNNAFVVILLRG